MSYIKVKSRFKTGIKPSVFLLTFLFIVSVVSAPLYGEVSLESGLELISSSIQSAPPIDISDSNLWIGVNWNGSHYFTDSLSLFADSSARVVGTPIDKIYEGIFAGDAYTSYRKEAFLIRWGISGYYDVIEDLSSQINTGGITTSAWELNSDILLSYGNYTFSVFLQPEIDFIYSSVTSTSFGAKAGAVVAVTEEVLLKPSVSIDWNSTDNTTITPTLVLSWYPGLPLSFQSKLGCSFYTDSTAGSDTPNIELNWSPELSLLFIRGVTILLDSNVNFKTYDTVTLTDGTTDTQYNPSLEIVPSVEFDFSLSDTLAIHSKLGMDFMHYTASGINDLSPSLSLSVELDF